MATVAHIRDAAGNDRPTRYSLSLALSVQDTTALWDAAARCCTGQEPPLSPDEIAELIGPREDPSIEDCLATLMLSRRLGGCAFLDIAVDPASEENALSEMPAATMAGPVRHASIA